MRGMLFFFVQAEDGIRDAQESRGLGDVYKRQHSAVLSDRCPQIAISVVNPFGKYKFKCCCNYGRTIIPSYTCVVHFWNPCLLYTSDAADEEDSVDLGGRRIIKKKKN